MTTTTNPRPTVTLDQCTRLLGPLAITLRAEVDAPTMRAYHRALKHVPLVLLRRAVRAAETGDFFPKPVELLRLAERERAALLTAHPFTPCVDCAATSAGWREVVEGGVVRLARCPCYRAWQTRLAELGATIERLVPSLPAAPAEPAPGLDFEGGR